jgi:hypothetical protein
MPRPRRSPMVFSRRSSWLSLLEGYTRKPLNSRLFLKPERGLEPLTCRLQGGEKQMPFSL